MTAVASTFVPMSHAPVLGLFEQARGVLAGSDELTRIEQSGADLAALRRLLVQVLRSVQLDRCEVEAIAQIIIRIDAHRRAAVATELEMYAARFAALRSVADAVGVATPTSLPRIVTTSLCGSLGYRKAMFSIVNGSSWSPASVSMQPDLEPMFGPLVSAVDGHGIELRDAPREAELVRKRRSYVLDRVDTYRHTYRPLIDLSRPSGYLAVPVVVGGRARAIIHVDRHEEGLTDMDVHMVGALAAVCTLSCERAELSRSFKARRSDVEAGIAQLGRALDELDASSVGFAVDIDEQGGPAVSAHSEVPTHAGVAAHTRTIALASTAGYVGPRPSLTHREWEVLELLAAGDTNSSISRALCISDGTVKSHVQRIFRKIDVSTRAEAAAFVAQRRVRVEDR